MAGHFHKLTSLCVAGLCVWGTLHASVSLGQGAARPYGRATPPLGGIDIPGMGPGSQPAQADQSIAQAQALHARVVRIAVPWSALQPRGPGAIEPYALAFLDRLTSDAGRAGIKVIMTVDSSPCWASSAPAALQQECSPAHWTRANAWPPSDPSTFAAVMSALAARYGSQLAALEIWNEPDQANEVYFAGPDKAQRYAALLRAAYPAIKQADPQVPVLAGSLVGSNGVFLRALYAAGIKGYYDGLAVHFYDFTLAALRATREVQLANGDATPMWLDEFGWSSCWPRQKLQQEQGCVTPKIQASNIASLFHSLARTPYVAAETLYELQGSKAEDFGVLNERGARKPAFSALARVLAHPLGKPSPLTLRLRRSHGHVVASGTGPVGDYMQLEALRAGVLRYKAIFTLDRFNRYAISLPRALGTHGVTVRVFQYWQGPGRDAQHSI